MLFNDKGQKHLNIRKLSLTVLSLVLSDTQNVQVVIFRTELTVVLSAYYLPLHREKNYYVYFPVQIYHKTSVDIESPRQWKTCRQIVQAAGQ